MKSTSKRTFYPGDEWLYFKLYTGIKTADDILIRSVFPVVKKLMREEILFSPLFRSGFSHSFPGVSKKS